MSFLPTPLAEHLLELEATPSLLPELRVLLTGGDLLHQPPACKLPYTLINNYGPTENSVVATSGKVSTIEQGHSTPSIGRPISNTRVYVLDQLMQPVPIGVPGELYASGEGLARGYLGHPDLTAEYFVPDPFTDRPGTRMYKTGDMVRYVNDGNLHFLGRNDQQIKIRGFRVEPGEIETILCQHPQIREAVVVAYEELSGNKRLIAYLVPDTASSPAPEQVRAYLQSKLPVYMIPSAIIILERLPLTSNGKLDRRALPAPESIPARNPSDDRCASPRNQIEELLVGVWSEVLGIEQVGIYDNFFELGGHSLLATQVIARIQQVFNVDLPLRSLFEQPRVAEFAQAISSSERSTGEFISKSINRISQDAVEQTLATLDDLSAEEVDALLSQLLPEHEGL